MVEQILEEHPAVFFKEMVEGAMQRTGFVSSNDSAFYLVRLLDQFVRPEGRYTDLGSRPDHPLGQTFLEGITSSGAERFVLLRFVGDMALFLNGFFPESLERRQVATEYYQRVGEKAYGHAAGCCRPRHNAPLFEELSGKFEDFSEVLHEVSERCAHPEPNDLLRIYRSWVETGSQRSAEQLERHGVVLSEGSRRVN